MRMVNTQNTVIRDSELTLIKVLRYNEDTYSKFKDEIATQLLAEMRKHKTGMSMTKMHRIAHLAADRFLIVWCSVDKE